MNEHSLKLHFCMFERSQKRHNSVDCVYFFGNIFHYLQSLHVQSLTQIKNVFACSKHSNLKKGSIVFVFFKHFFF